MTNRKDLIDEALLRPGRMEVQVEISKFSLTKLSNQGDFNTLYKIMDHRSEQSHFYL